MKIFNRGVLILILTVLCGCALFRFRSQEVYPMSFDATYSMVTSALSDMQTDRLDTWRLVETDYGRGIITVEAGGYWTQERKVRFLIERLAPFRTKVELNGKWATPFTQKFFKAMDKRYAEQALTHPT